MNKANIFLALFSVFLFAGCNKETISDEFLTPGTYKITQYSTKKTGIDPMTQMELNEEVVLENLGEFIILDGKVANHSGPLMTFKINDEYIVTYKNLEKVIYLRYDKDEKVDNEHISMRNGDGRVIERWIPGNWKDPQNYALGIQKFYTIPNDYYETRVIRLKDNQYRILIIQRNLDQTQIEVRIELSR